MLQQLCSCNSALNQKPAVVTNWPLKLTLSLKNDSAFLPFEKDVFLSVSECMLNKSGYPWSSEGDIGPSGTGIT